jgi:NAD(P)-dependent dehydrogenase (short-subunit alcohol dehydrogenase family)
VLGTERATNRMYRAWRFENELCHLVAACRQDPALEALLRDGAWRQRLAATLVDIEMVKGHVEPMVEALVAGQPLGRLGTVEDIAKAICFLATDQAGFVTG